MPTMNDLRIITNNPEVKNIAGAEYYEDDTFLQILIRVRDLIHQNYRLCSHPLAGSVKPNETPYKSVALYADKGTSLDLASLQIIEAAIQITRQFLQDRALPSWNNKIRAEFALIDASILQSGLNQLRV